MDNSQIPDNFHRLKRLFSVDEKDFFEKVILKNLFNIKEDEQATLVLYPTGHITLEETPLEVFEVVEKILERKAEDKKARDFFEEAYFQGIIEDSFSNENLV